MPGCKLGGILDPILNRIVGLKNEVGVGGRILIQIMDMKSSYRQVALGPDGESHFTYYLGQFPFVDFRLQLGWSLWWWAGGESNPGRPEEGGDG